MQAFALTDKGTFRTSNQDYFYCQPCKTGVLPNLFIVADGMGGHLAGDYASKYTATRIAELIEQNVSEQPALKLINDCIQKVNYELFDKARRDADYYKMGTTMVLCYLEDNIVHVANVGDSRLYIINSSEIRQITHDHSLVEELVAQGSIEKDSSTYYEKKNVITRAIGAAGFVNVDYFEEELSDGDVVLLCSDGLTNMVSDEEIMSIINKYNDLEECTKELINRANYNGGMDNISVVVIKQDWEAVL